MLRKSILTILFASVSMAAQVGTGRQYPSKNNNDRRDNEKLTHTKPPLERPSTNPILVGFRTPSLNDRERALLHACGIQMAESGRRHYGILWEALDGVIAHDHCAPP